MKEEILDITKKLYHNHLTPETATNLLLDLFADNGRHHWLQKDDLEFAIALQEENRLEAVKWLCDKAKGHSLTPLKDAKDILDAYR